MGCGEDAAEGLASPQGGRGLARASHRQVGPWGAKRGPCLLSWDRDLGGPQCF